MSPLDPGTNALIRLAGAIALGEESELRQRIDDAIAVATSAVWIDELLLQSVLMVGWPRTLIAAGMWRSAIGAPAIDTEADSDEAGQAGTWEKRGEETCRVVYGDNYDKLRQNVSTLHPALDRWMVVEGYGRTLSRPGLDLRRRELCVVAQTAVLDTPRQLHSHLRGSLHAGASIEEIEAALRSVNHVIPHHQWKAVRELWDKVRLGLEFSRMSFVDRVVVEVTAGGGGDGACSFARFKYRPKGGPDGGDGGPGGSVLIRADANLSTLLDYQYRANWAAQRGVHGKGKNMTGAAGADIVLPVPPGTVVDDEASGKRLGELLRSGDELLVARGGRGGRGNSRFASATHQAPREWEEGGKGDQRRLVLTLKLIADVGLVGEPNAGKSTLLSVVSAARPKIADYPFTTLEPNLGVVGMDGSRTFVVADIPGIIEGAHAGKGLGLKFLQHVERTRVLAYLIPLDAPDHSAVYQKLRHEVRQYSESLAEREHVVVLTKRDLLPADESLPEIANSDAKQLLTISSASGTGLEALKEALWQMVAAARAQEEFTEDAFDFGDDDSPPEGSARG